MIIVFGYQPFTSTLIVPSSVRVPALIALVGCMLIFSIRKKKAFYFTLVFIPVSLALFMMWRTNAPAMASVTIYTLCLIAFTAYGVIAMERMPYLKEAIKHFMMLIVLVFSVQSILAFVCFNFNLVPFSSLRLGGFDFYEYYYNPLMGYINPKDFESGIIGRPTGYMFEPSYLSWFLTTNFFLLKDFTRNQPWVRLYAQPIVFAGAVCTFSTAAWLVFGSIFALSCLRKVLLKMSGNQSKAKKWSRVLFVVVICFIMFVPKEQIMGALGTSSFGDRDARMQVSMLMLATGGPVKLLMGHSPGYVESNAEKAESNQLIKLLVEEGLIITILSIWFIIYCTRKNENYMWATILFLNSVVVLWTPIFILNILVCKWLNNTHAEYNRPSQLPELNTLRTA